MKMEKVTMLIELEYSAELMHDDDIDAKEWFFGILSSGGGELRLVSREIGDEIGGISSARILQPSLDPDACPCCRAKPAKSETCPNCGKPFLFGYCLHCE
jgi:hypothetical protein